ncbi:MAG: DUF29 domain-containing protein [Stellaceae bacterium]
MADTRTLYDEDFVTWSRQQAEALRAAARTGSNLELDWENLAEEVEGLGASERRTLHSQVQRIIRHLLKLEYSSALDPRRGWIETVNDARSEIELVLEMSPSLRNQAEAVAEAERIRGSQSAIRDLEKYGEINAAGIPAIRGTHYTIDQILGDWFPAEPTAKPHRDD